MEDLKNAGRMKEMLTVRYYPEGKVEDAVIKDYKKIPYGALAALGVAFASMPEEIRTLTVEETSHVDGLFRCTFPEGIVGELAKFKDGSGFMGDIRGAQNIVGKARWNPVTDVTKEMTVMISYDPTMFFLAILLLSITQKLTAIEQSQKQILEFLEEDKKAELKGNMNYLFELCGQYRLNYENEDFIRTRLVKVQDIKQDSEQKSIFYQQRIQKLLEENGHLKTGAAIHKKLKELTVKFQNYQTAEYLYAYSSFLDVLLLKNYSRDHLIFLEEALNAHALRYRETYTACYNKYEGLLGKSLNAFVSGGFAGISKLCASTIHQIPIVEKGPVDELLASLGEKAEDFTAEQIQNQLQIFLSLKDTYTGEFVEQINNINVLYNEPLDVCIEKGNLYYLPSAI